MVTPLALHHPIVIKSINKHNTDNLTSSGLGGALLTTGEGAGLLGDAALSAIDKCLVEPLFLLLATAHMWRNLCCSSCSQRACLAPNTSSLTSYSMQCNKIH